MNTFNLTLDLNKSRASSPVRLRQGDKSGTTIMALILDHGATANLTGMTAQLVMELPDGTQYYRKSASVSGNVVTVVVDESTAASVSGRTANAYFQMLQGTTVKASTGSFAVEILPDALEGHTVPESYDSAIQDAIDALDAAVEQMPDMVEDVLADHPEWTTTVQDGSITAPKLATDLARDRERLLYRLDNLLTNALPEGETATASDAAKTPMAALALYGRSTQDGTPTPDAPVPIVSVAPDSQGNINLWAKRTSDASTYTVTPIDLDGHELRSLPDGTRDEVTVDERGHAVLVQRVASATLSGASSEGWEVQTVTSGNRFRVKLDGLPSGASLANEDVVGYIACDHFKTTCDSKGGNAGTYNGEVGISARRTTGQQVLIYHDGETLANWLTWLASNPITIDYKLATPVTHDLGYVAAVPLCGPDLTAQAIPTAPMQLTYERDLNTTLARLESAIATLA